MKNILVTELKQAIAGLGYKDIKTLSPNSFGIVVAKTKVSKVVPEVMNALKDYEPKVISDVEVRIGDKSVFAKNANMQKGRKAFSGGRGNEFNLMASP